MITVADLIFHEDAFDTIDFTRGGLRENDKEVVSMMIQEMNNEREKMLTENTPENIKRLRQKLAWRKENVLKYSAWTREPGVARKNLPELQAVQHLHQ